MIATPDERGWFLNCASRRPGVSFHVLRASQNNFGYTMEIIFNRNFVSIFAKMKSSQFLAFFGIFCFQLNSNLNFLRHNSIVVQ